MCISGDDRRSPAHLPYRVVAEKGVKAVLPPIHLATSRVMKKSKICRKSIEIYGFLRYKMVLAGPKIGTFSAAC
jgi:hypothetical protein